MVVIACITCCGAVYNLCLVLLLYMYFCACIFQLLLIILMSVGSTLPMAQRCQELEWVSIPLAVANVWQLGYRGPKHLLTTGISSFNQPVLPKSKIISEIYGQLNLPLVRSVAVPY